MSSTSKNLLVLGSTLLCIVVFLPVYDISISSQVIRNSKDSNYLIKLANRDAAENIKKNNLYLIAVAPNWLDFQIPGVGREKYYNCYRKLVPYKNFVTVTHGSRREYSNYELQGTDPREQVMYALTYNTAISSYLASKGLAKCF